MAIGLLSSAAAYYFVGQRRMQEAAEAVESQEQLGLESLRRTLRHWDDAVRLAEHTPRGQLLDPISRLQELKRSTESLNSNCMTYGGMGALRLGMEVGISAFLQHLRAGNDQFDPASLDYMRERMSVGVRALQTNCGL
ncbi:MAG: hypothetical protein EOO27_01655 [Comamonadaceae bacterium]|nr:MAG: hypothetical protein EOO27_01655 [Comamonadaceae bacterium]